jgi:hypothetical protein
MKRPLIERGPRAAAKSITYARTERPPARPERVAGRVQGDKSAVGGLDVRVGLVGQGDVEKVLEDLRRTNSGSHSCPLPSPRPRRSDTYRMVEPISDVGRLLHEVDKQGRPVSGRARL